MTLSRSRSTTLRTFASCARTCCGVKPLFTSLRRCQCTGSSCSIIIPVGPLSGRIPPPLDHTSGCFEICLMSSYFVMPQTPAVSFQWTGEFARNHVSAACGSAPQNSPLTKFRSGISSTKPLCHDFVGVVTKRRSQMRDVAGGFAEARGGRRKRRAVDERDAASRDDVIVSGQASHVVHLDGRDARLDQRLHGGRSG